VKKDIKIAADVMGGDLGPEPLIQGCINFVRKTNTKVVIVGDETLIRKIVERENIGYENIEISHTQQFITMGEKVSKTFRKKRNASVAIAARLVKSGYCDGFFTIGNTGSAVLWSRIILKRVKGIKRTALCGALFNKKGITIILDCGANIKTGVESFIQFAEMGDVFASSFINQSKPRIGLLNIGKEETKGKFKIQWANHVLRKSDLNYIGFIEGNDLVKGEVDVAVCDGFTGNIILKYSEAVFSLFSSYDNVLPDKKEYLKNIFGDAVSNIKKLNGAPLLGVNGISVIGHGASNDIDYESGLSITKFFIESNLLERLKQKFENKRTTLTRKV